MRALDMMGVDYYVIVEKAEWQAYADAGIRESRLLVLPPEYQARYDTCDRLGGTKSTGPGPARNFAWDLAKAQGAPWHWVMDDNIRGFHRLNRNGKHVVTTPGIFHAMEDFADRFSNVAMAGPNYHTFGRKDYPYKQPYVLNTRIYSCNLIRTDTPFRWRGRYNEDTDLSLRMLKAGWCTVQFYAFLQNKTVTQATKGGNTEEFYRHEGTWPKTQMLAMLHPDLTSVVHKFGRVHHQVNYLGFKQQLVLRTASRLPRHARGEYGMRLEEYARHTVATTPARFDTSPSDLVKVP